MKNLNVTALTAVVAVLAAGLLVGVAAQADTIAPQTGLTRAEVKAELAEARATGELHAYRPAADFSNEIAPAPSAKAGVAVKNAPAAAQVRQPVATTAQASKTETVSGE